jgi:hypothetical protein
VALTPKLDTIEALYRKLERECYRTMHASNAVHQADHFYNFCITAHAMRDYLLERLGCQTPPDQLRHTWETNPELVAVADIANSVKHFTLRHPRTRAPRQALTREVKPARHTMVDFYLSVDGTLESRKRRGVPTLTITPFHGHPMQVYTFMKRVLAYWKGCLGTHGVRPRKQSARSLHGTAT